MSALDSLWLTQPFWAWLAAGAILLAAELLTGSGWLLWPAGAAAALALLNVAVHDISLAGQCAIFAIVAAAGTLAVRPWTRRGRGGHDINDQQLRMIGHAGRAATAFAQGRGRVLVDGKEWAADLEGAEALAAGAAVEVTAVLGGARLRVRAP